MTKTKRGALVAILVVACVVSVLAASSADNNDNGKPDGPGWMLIAIGAIGLFATGAWKAFEKLQQADEKNSAHIGELYKRVDHSGNRLTRIETKLNLPPLPSDGNQG